MGEGEDSACRAIPPYCCRPPRCWPRNSGLIEAIPQRIGAAGRPPYTCAFVDHFTFYVTHPFLECLHTYLTCAVQ